ncbi:MULTISPECIES: 2-dehydro-3-deoxy-6-phosphogalactonate aldolase [unclassified Pseudomonas]|uniref:2-dehydro-3-deoxy-6-phosphogalactonate aldolase n=1 Tax=unclassified Pseudomonas TaxID=196821 RepID=UPI000BD2128B|nr:MULTISPECIES: 2-dehydro-3-deoxy-6-phosphogalactonate aldolase [unclassified Pseudomonas]PVZ20319.1 2-dehydro-3-deoxyphosphogalactonate aldolase [Pseudomonas sp. URIL14HWK12:I12]PVZ27385.1 2-dehydro-3-deoxyphosphogalactonate aldolase [Pseudomonas sp. URIL14HWK12:I10]PVZ38274.1 2-dehydro-3-deoxyphosphogalactonate aldolase [Pseudomonas sp. URIL14HWK12:I11]SNZ04005.1 2-keto-3-deoxy-phosphogalactonate aldolase [Pseudomonas sp. URIL14HWK12:I9]
MLDATLAKNGLIAILRGLRPEQAAAVGDVLYEEGFRVIEVPLNSPQPLDSIRLLRERLPADCLIGAGTVMTPEQVRQVKAAGGQLIVMPHCDARVLKAAKAEGLYLAPGIATPTEAFSALEQGADLLKLFPAEALSPAVAKALLAVLPAGTRLAPVGGISPDTLKPWFDAGARAFGLGSGLFTPALSPNDIRSRAQAYMAAWHAVAA